MTRILLTLAFATLGAATAQSQTIYDPQIGSEPLRAYLELSETQSKSISEINLRFRQYQSSRAQRQLALQIEIGRETAQDPIDPQALGLRYRELELIKREIEAERVKTRTELQAVLTAAQKTKLTALEQALQLQSTACAAVEQNLLVAPVLKWFDTSDFASFLLGSPSGLSGPCASPASAFGRVVR